MIKTYLIVFYFVPSRFFNVHAAAKLMAYASGTLLFSFTVARPAVQLMPCKRYR